MRAVKVLALTAACLLAAGGGVLFQRPDAPLAFLTAFSVAVAEPAKSENAVDVPSSPDPARPEPAKVAPLPDFVPQPHALTRTDNSAQSAEDPEGPTPPTDTPAAAPADTTTGSVSSDSAASAAPAESASSARAVEIKVEPIPGMAPAKAPVWPKFIGAKNLFGEAKKPAPMEARAIGSYSRGCLAGAVPLPIDGPAWQEMRLSRNRNWGHPQLISLVEKFANDAQKLDGWPGLLVGDIAQPRGGPMITGHASHQIGLDADIWLTPMPKNRLSRKERETLEATSMLDSTSLAVDPKVFTAKQVALIKRAASYPEVERIFVHPAIKKALCKAAGTDHAWLGKVRPWYGHYYHFHMRIKCPAGMTVCSPQPPPTGDDGCGKEVDAWLAKVIPAKTTPAPIPQPSGPPKAPRPPLMLAELPKECQAVLAAGPDAVKIPPEALMTTAQVKKALAKAAAVNLALAKASTATAAKGTGAQLARSPALRPHLHKSATADPK
ncbi:penicillin-insensitive murein endopeptidase [Hyphomicrobium sp.]|uniref:penicillin-insensitive murein endopeptidase n=1 Tax=Hyphomicrobium sp. TaxID=82 RepID=UPI000F978B8C|nr:MAG: penicillin-insensitive murein endopeptidase [Hyphomicrobium sp.]